jgi:hypothetical protein
VFFFGYGLGRDLGGEKALYFISLELYPFGSLIWSENFYFVFSSHFFFPIPLFFIFSSTPFFFIPFPPRKIFFDDYGIKEGKGQLS